MVLRKQRDLPAGGYVAESKVDWDDEYGGPVRLWAYTYDREFRESPEVGTDLIYPKESR